MDIELSLRLIQQNFPHITIQSADPITRGWDSFVLDINDDLIFRFPQRDDVVPYLAREIRLLLLLAPTLSVPIPRFDFIGHLNEDYPYTFVGYHKLQGMPLEDEQITEGQLTMLASALGTFLSELHRFSHEQAAHASVEIHTPALWRKRYQERYEDVQTRVFPFLDEELRAKSTRIWERFLHDDSLFVFQSTLIHCDLAGEHILCAPQHGTLTGIIDWGDVTVGDPALDFVGLHLTHGKAFTERVLSCYQGNIDSAFWQRIGFYLDYIPYAFLLYGAYCNDEQFIAQGVEMLRALT